MLADEGFQLDVSCGCTNWWPNCCSQSNVGAFDFHNRLGIQFYTENSATFLQCKWSIFVNCRVETLMCSSIICRVFAPLIHFYTFSFQKENRLHSLRCISVLQRHQNLSQKNLIALINHATVNRHARTSKQNLEPTGRGKNISPLCLLQQQTPTPKKYEGCVHKIFIHILTSWT